MILFIVHKNAHACIFDDLLITEPDNKELQEAVSKTTFQHDLTNLEPATTYSVYLKAYSPVGASQKSSTVVATTLGGGMYLFAMYAKSP